jgi:hypothetical protein
MLTITKVSYEYGRKKFFSCHSCIQETLIEKSKDHTGAKYKVR